MKQLMVAFALVSILCTSCKKNDNSNPPPPPPPEPPSPAGVYSVTMSLFKGTRVWKDDKVEYDVNDDFTPLAITLYGEDIYVAGSNPVNGSRSAGVYWNTVDKIKREVTNGFNDATFYDLRVVPLDAQATETRLYLCGYETPEDTRVAKIWWRRSGSGEQVLTNGENDAEVFGMTTGNDFLYFAGYERNDDGIKIAKYWKLDKEANIIEVVSLSDGSSHGIASGIIVKGNDVFVCGTYDGESALWKNGVRTDVAPGVAAGRPAMAITASNEICIAFTSLSGDDHFATVWRNGQVILNAKDGYANSISVRDNEVYVGGGYGDPATPCYWKGTEKVNLDPDDEAEIFALIVK